MAQKRPRSSSDDAACTIDDEATAVAAVKRQHVEQPADREQLNQRLLTVAQLSRAAQDVTLNQAGSDNTAAPQPSAPAVLLFRPRQLTTAAAAGSLVLAQQPSRSVATSPAHELPVLRTIDWRSTNSDEDSPMSEDDDEAQQEQQQHEREDEDKEEREAEQHAENGAASPAVDDADMQVDGVVSRIHLLAMPRRVAFGRRQPMPIIRPVRQQTTE